MADEIPRVPSDQRSAWAELLAEFETNRAATIRAVEAADEALFARRIHSAFGVVGPLMA